MLTQQLAGRLAPRLGTEIAHHHQRLRQSLLGKPLPASGESQLAFAVRLRPNDQTDLPMAQLVQVIQREADAIVRHVNSVEGVRTVQNLVRIVK